ncbi:hypothetical protein M409DRAFT_48849 [Zasmidium cellare ATCC 36951]|uniref:F-box domain-containing protein n=1 Tax=Zasmidium cellare ATCC 36951 TaxID=1080233 RepID=A0A6A6D3F2_ZASCE|nr:uncharacterized protein M409DRAFT_48849 [Zasmidium cellare ATCC 36951]KAF2173944.1 hypothetical protein M409DRAFT_48849 [Zasmidium cellare ATCC 36951]
MGDNMEGDTAAAKAFAAHARNLLTDGLRKDFPHMDLMDVDRTVNRAVQEIANGLEQAKPQMRASKSKSGFFSLPPEIRNDIYNLVFPASDSNPTVTFKEPKNVGKKAKNAVIADFAFPKFLHASRQIRNEAMPIFLSSLCVRVLAALYLNGSEVSTARCEKDQAPLSMTWIAGLGKEHAKMIKKFTTFVDALQFGRRRETPLSLELRGTNGEILEDLGFSELGMRKEAMGLSFPTTFGSSLKVGWKSRTDEYDLTSNHATNSTSVYRIMDDDDDTKSSKALLADTRTSLTEDLRYQFPFMRTSLMNEAVEATLTALQQKVEEAKPQITASKARSSFFSLPAELRTYIYDLSFAPTDQGTYHAVLDESRYPLKRRGCYRATGSGPYQTAGPDPRVGFPALLHASRQVRAEAMPVFLRNLTVLVASDRLEDWDSHDDVVVARAWLRGLGPKYVKLVKKFVLSPVTAGGVPDKSRLWEMFGFGGLGLREDAVEVSVLHMVFCEQLMLENT